MEEKKHEQWIKQFYRTIGYKIAYFLNSHTKITANQVTYFRALCGLITVVLFYYADGSLLKLSGLTILLFGGLDAADGCLAQIQGKSYFGGWIDSMADVTIVFLILLALSLRFNKMYPNDLLLTLLPLVTFCLMQILNRAYDIKNNAKLFGDGVLDSDGSDRSFDTRDSRTILQRIKMQLGPIMYNYHIILIAGAISGQMKIATFFLFGFVTFWLIGMFVNTCFLGMRLDRHR